MSAVYHHEGKRGDLDLYYENDMIAVDVTEHRLLPNGFKRDAEMFIHLDDIDGLIEALTTMRAHLARRYRKTIITIEGA